MQLPAQLQANQNDLTSRQGLLQMIGRRKLRLSYLRGIGQARYSQLIAKLGIRC